MKQKFRVELIKADVPSATGRIYPRAVLEKAVAGFQKTIDSGKAVGGMSNEEGLQLSMANITHRITQLSLGDDGIMNGEIEILDTPRGKQLKNLIEVLANQGAPNEILGSPIGIGTVSKERSVRSDYHLLRMNVLISPDAEKS